MLKNKKGLMVLALGLTSMGLVGCNNAEQAETVNQQASEKSGIQVNNGNSGKVGDSGVAGKVGKAGEDGKKGNPGKDGLIFEEKAEKTVVETKEVVSLDIASLVNSEANTDERFIFDTETGTILLYKGTDLNVVIPEELGGVKVRAIGDSAFNSHETTFKITGVTLPSGLEVIGDRAFSRNSLTVLDLSVCKGLVSIGDHAFIANKLTDLVLPRSVKELGQGAFSNNQLINVNLGLVEDIGESAFVWNQLTEVVLPSSLKVVGSNAFGDNLITRVSKAKELKLGKDVFNHQEVQVNNLYQIR